MYMEKLRDFFRSLAAHGVSARAEGGQALIEYALIISLVAVLAIVALQLTGTNIKSLLNKIAGEV
jgi:Flp pilus assembly pilin Flp